MNREKGKMKTFETKKYEKLSADLGDPKSILLPENTLRKEELISAVRLSIIAENDAVILYETYANSTDNKKAKKVFNSIADEERVHVGEFKALLEYLGGNNEKEKVEEGEEEVKKDFLGEENENIKNS